MRGNVKKKYFPTELRPRREFVLAFSPMFSARIVSSAVANRVIDLLGEEQRGRQRRVAALQSGFPS